MRERTTLQDRLGSMAKIERELDDATTLVELGEQEGDAETENEGLAQLRALKTEGERRELEALAKLGGRLQLPAWCEPNRAAIEARLPPLD